MATKKLSIIVPCYKVEKYLPRCLDSLVNQTLKEIEIICINDGSPDNCLQILKDYQEKYKDKIVIIDKKNEGVWRGRKDGIKKATGEFIGFVDSDDYVDKTFAEKLYNKAKKENADIAVCGFDRIDLDTGKTISKEMCKEETKIIDVKENMGALLELNGAPWNKIYKANLLKNQKDLTNPPKILDDMMFLLLVYLNAKKVAFVKESLVYYMIRKDSIINTIKKEQIESTYNAMLEVKEIYKQRKRKNTLELLDAMAFLHLGISLMFRLSYDKNCNLKQAIKDNTKFLDENFKTWRKSKYIRLSYVLKNHVNGKLWIVKIIYKCHLFRAFLKVYRFMIHHLGIDIKW